MPVGAAMIGTGMWARRLAAAVRHTPALRLVTCYSRDPGRCRAFGEEVGCAAAPTFEAAVEHPDVEGVVVVTPNFVHAEQVAACAARRRHVFVEKPIADTLEDGRRMRLACERAGVVLMVGHGFRRLGAARAVKGLLDEGRLGAVVLAEANFSLPGTLTPDQWRAHRETCPGGPLLQLGIHHADTLRYWLGSVRAVRGTFARVATPAEIDDVGVAVLDFDGGARATITGSYVSPKTFWLRLYGTEGVVAYETDMSVWPRAERMDGATRLRLMTRTGVQEVAFEPRDMLVEELEEFAAAVRGEARPETGALEALAALAVIRAALASHETGTVVAPEER